MYVHQSCLMEWLSHSQKKHCELCKTSFRFTKLYKPDMPDRLPVGIFLRKAFVHTVGTFAYWLRACLVASTWLIWLPWTMRFVWWGLFWLADVGWVKAPGAYSDQQSGQNTTASLHNATSVDVRTALLSELVKGPAVVRVTSWLLRSLASRSNKGWLSDLTPDNHLQSDMLRNNMQLSERGTLLSGVNFLNSLTSSALANRVIIDVLEGQLVTVALVTLIILVLLIREWVVQQQPIVNMAEENDEVRQALQRHAMRAEHRGNESQASQSHDPTTKSRELVLEEFLSQEDQELPVEIHRADTNAIQDLLDRTRAVCDRGRDAATASSQRYKLDGSEGTEATTILQQANETSTALGRVYAKAFRHKDASELQSLQHRIQMFQEVVQSFSSDKNQKLELVANELRLSISGTLSNFDNHLSETDRDSQNGTEPNADERSSTSSIQESGPQTTTEDDAQMNGSGRRPLMPPRDESFVATEIQRSLQEGSFDPETGKQDVNEERGPRISIVHEQAVNDNDAGKLPAKQLADLSASGPVHQSQQSSVDDTKGHDSLIADESMSEPLQTPVARSSPTTVGSVREGSISASAPRVSEQGRVDAAVNGSSQEDARSDDQQAAAADEMGQENFFDKVVDWMWGDLDIPQVLNMDQNDREHVRDTGLEVSNEHEANLAEDLIEDANRQIEALAVDNDHVPREPQAHEDVPRAPAALLNEADALEDAEDLEGVLELIGLQGALVNLFTNAVFASVFVSCTIVIAVWLPFLTGKIALILLVHPLAMAVAPFKFLIRATNTVSDILLLFSAGCVQWLIVKPGVLLGGENFKALSARLIRSDTLEMLDATAMDAISKASARLIATFGNVVDGTDTAYSNLTLDSHAAVRSLQHIAARITQACGIGLTTSVSWLRSLSWDNIGRMLQISKSSYYRFISPSALVEGLRGMSTSFNVLVQSDSWPIASRPDHPGDTIKQITPSWTALDRGLATFLGYSLITLVGAVYFVRFAPIARSRQNRKIELIVLEVMQQAGGIAKVVLIISIEMLVFPLYCGLLLDVAMLPLFASASIENRFQFTLTSPWTSLFVHWFVGTAYMFHFALFVAMCRKIFRKGVLYFIRDPDDPTFHPVRDVLERTVMSQLRKIATSALIYGGLVITCVGSVIWTLRYTTRGLLPINWTAYSDANAFPMDLVLYIFVRPLAVKHLNMSDWVQVVYQWFFRRCARLLFLSDFLFGEKDDRAIRSQSESNDRVSQGEASTGRWLRVPANDQVRIGSGRKAFTPVNPETQLHDRTESIPVDDKDADFMTVYVPPRFRLRLIAFVCCLWLLTAAIGFAFTLCPLMLGRWILLFFAPESALVNDIYAYAVGMFVLCVSALTIVTMRKHVHPRAWAHNPGTFRTSTIWSKFRAVLDVARTSILNHAPRAGSCLYTHTMLWVLIPMMFALLLQLYILGPLSAASHAEDGPYRIRLSESLAIGIQLVRMLLSILNWNPESRGARALAAIFASGYSNPRPSLANRYLFLPIMTATVASLLAPISLAEVANRTLWYEEGEAVHQQVRIFSYPMAMVTILGAWTMRYVVHLTRRWRTRIRDEVFLIGERLHNYGEKKPPAIANRHSSVRVLR